MLQARLYALIALGVVALGGLAWGGHRLYKAGYNEALLDRVKDAELIQNAALAAQTAASQAIAKIEVKHVTIRQNLEKELTHDVVYRDCVASPRVLELTNQALTGIPDTPADSVVPVPEPIN